MDRIWLKNYPEGVPADIYDQAAAYPSLAAMLEDSCKRYADKVAYISLGSTLTYAELDVHSRHFAAWLQSIGVKQGDRVALMMPNLLQYPVCLFGTLRAGAVVVNTNPLYTAHELEYQLSDSGAETVVIAENFAHTLQAALPRTPIKNIVVASVGDMLGPVKGAIINFVLRYLRKKVPAWSLPGSHSYTRTQIMGKSLPFATPTLSHADLACLQYTGGTTGLAKGAMLSHGNLISNVCQAHAWIKPTITEGEECIVTALPLYHIFALTANALVFMKIGATNLLIVDPRDIGAFVKTLGTVRFTAITGVNTLFNALLNHPDFDRLNFSSLRIVLGGGMAVQEAVARRWLSVTGKPIAQAYGLTETSPAVTINLLDGTDFNGSIGLPIPSTDISIRDDNSIEVAQGESGEICVKGPQVTAGYWQRPQETALTFEADGFLRTGDIGRIDEKGYIYLLDRKKDMILVSGFNVYPSEIEAVALLHPDVLDAAAVGVPDGHSGEVVKLFVIRKHSSLTAEMLIAHCHTLLTGYKVPKYIEFRDALPRSSIGKTLRRKLKE